MLAKQRIFVIAYQNILPVVDVVVVSSNGTHAQQESAMVIHNTIIKPFVQHSDRERKVELLLSHQTPVRRFHEN